MCAAPAPKCALKFSFDRSRMTRSAQELADSAFAELGATDFAALIAKARAPDADARRDAIDGAVNIVEMLGILSELSTIRPLTDEVFTPLRIFRAAVRDPDPRKRHNPSARDIEFILVKLEALVRGARSPSGRCLPEAGRCREDVVADLYM